MNIVLNNGRSGDHGNIKLIVPDLAYEQIPDSYYFSIDNPAPADLRSVVFSLALPFASLRGFGGRR